MPINKNRRLLESFVSFALGVVLATPVGYLGRFCEMRMQVYMASLSFYHFIEYFYVCFFHYTTLTIDSKII